MQDLNQLKLEEHLIVSEYESIRKEIQARLLRIFRLHQGLLLGTLIYATTFYLPKFWSTMNAINLSEANNTSRTIPMISMLYYAFLFILPFVAFVVELLCTSEQDAIFRAGIYIRDNVEKIYRKSTFRGWEDWLVRQDKVERRRTSDRLIILARRYVILPLYCLASSIICVLGITTLLQLNLIHFKTAIIVVGVFLFYLSILYILISVLNKAQKDEFTSPLYNLLVLDVDGCLLNRNKKISRANSQAISFLKKRGVHIVLASGRGALSLKHICEELSLNGRHVTCHGASAYDASNKAEQQLSSVLTNTDLKSIIRKLNEYNVIWVAFGKSNYYCRKRDFDRVSNSLIARTDLTSEEIGVLKGIEDELTFEFSEDISKILCYLNIDERTKIRSLSKDLSNRYLLMMSTDETLEILNKMTSKKDAINQIIEKNYDPQNMRTIVVGDYDNDIDMLKWGHQAVAPSNASMKVRNLKGVNILDVSNDEDLIWEVARAYFNLRATKERQIQEV